MVCEICNIAKGKRTIASISMCENCFSKLTLLRNNDIKTIAYFKNDFNMEQSSEKARKYINSLLQQKLKENVDQLDEINKKEQYENSKMDFALSFDEHYEYDVVTIENKIHGHIDTDLLKNCLSKYAKKGWRLHSIYSNELGKNALLGINATASEDVLIFERRIKNPLSKAE